MDRTFHRGTSIQNLAAIVMLGAVGFACFWHHQPLIGSLVAILALVGIERTIHTTYRLTPQGTLHIDKGRLSRPVCISVDDITAVRECKARPLRPSHIIIEIGSRQMIAIQPEHPEAFVAELQKRMKATGQDA